MLEPYQGRVYDPAMGSGGFFVQSEKFIEEQVAELNRQFAELQAHRRKVMTMRDWIAKLDDFASGD